jgi:alkaline phosphatase
MLNQPQKLFIQTMPHIALMDTSAADNWVTDSAAGMSAIVTGQKTNNGVLSQSAAAVRGKKDGEVLEIRGSRFTIESITRRHMRLKLLPLK